MGINIVWTALAALAFVVLSHAAMAQQRETARWSRVRGESFIFARYATTGAGSLIAAARVGSGMLVGGVTGNIMPATARSDMRWHSWVFR